MNTDRQEQQAFDEERRNRMSFEKIVHTLLDKYAPGIDIESGVISRLSEYALRQQIEIIQEGDKIADYKDQQCINAEHVRIAQDNINERNNFINNEDLEKFAREKNHYKPQIQTEENIISTVNQENTQLRPTKHLIDIEKKEDSRIINPIHIKDKSDFPSNAKSQNTSNLTQRKPNTGEFYELDAGDQGAEKKLKTDD